MYYFASDSTSIYTKAMFGFKPNNKPIGFHYSNHLLKKVDIMLSCDDMNQKPNEIIPQLSEVLKAFYPQVEVHELLEVEVSKPSKTEKAVINERDSKISAIYFHQTVLNTEFNPSNCSNICLNFKEKSIQIRIIGEDYLCFKDTMQPLLSHLPDLTKLLQVNKFTGLVLRKLNMLPISAIVKDKFSLIKSMEILFQPKWILGSTDDSTSSQLTTSLINLLFLEDNHQLHLVYGILPKEDEIGSRLLLDLTIERLMDCSLENTTTTLNDLNDQLFDVFEAFISDRVKDFMNSTLNQF